MGHDATNLLPAGISQRRVDRTLLDLGFERRPRSRPYAYYRPPNADEELTGVWAGLYEADGRLRVDVHTTIWASPSDVRVLNQTVAGIKRQLGGGFSSDDGPNAYVTCDQPDRRKAEALAYRAYATFEDNLAIARLVGDQVVIRDQEMFDRVRDFMPHPGPALNYMFLPFLSAILETHLRSTYVGLLKYSDRRSAVIKATRPLGPDELEQIANGSSSVEDAIARARSFQTADKAAQAYRELDPRIDLRAVLSRPYRRRRTSLFESLADLLERRHAFVHALEMSQPYEDIDRHADVDNVEASVKRFYDHIISTYGWQAR